MCLGGGASYPDLGPRDTSNELIVSKYELSEENKAKNLKRSKSLVKFDNNNNDGFDLFAIAGEKKDWSDHPRYEALLQTGMEMMATVGFKSPKAKQKPKLQYSPWLSQWASKIFQPDRRPKLWWYAPWQSRGSKNLTKRPALTM